MGKYLIVLLFAVAASAWTVAENAEKLENEQLLLREIHRIKEKLGIRFSY